MDEQNSPPSKRRKSDKEEGDTNELAKLKLSALSYLEKSIDSSSPEGDYSKLLERVVDAKEAYTKPSALITEINKLLASRNFRRESFLTALFSKGALPPLEFIYLLHTNDIIPLRDFIENMPERVIDQFVQLLKDEFYSTERRDYIFDGFLVVLVTLQVENMTSSRSFVPSILNKLSNCEGGEDMRLLHAILQRVSKMRPERIPKLFFVTRLRQFLGSNGPQSKISLLENQVKPILNPGPEDNSGKSKDTAADTRTIKIKIFLEFISVLQKSELVDTIVSVARSMQCEWEILVEFLLYIISKVRDFGSLFPDPLQGVAKEAVLNLNTPLMKVAFILSWLAVPLPMYSEWFTANFCAPTSISTSKQQKLFVASSMAALIRVESSELSKIHRATLKKFPEMKTVMHEYTVIDKHSPNSTVSSSIGRTASLDDAIFNARSFLESFRLQGKVPDKLKTMQYFGPVWFRGTFIPALQSLEEIQKHNPNPDFKDIHLLNKALHANGIITQNDMNSWKASQDEQIAKVNAAIRLSKGRDAEKGRRPIDPLKSLLREFVDRARLHNFQDVASLFTEIASRLNDYISEHPNHTISCINLLLHSFCEATKILNSNHEDGGEAKGKNTNVQWTGHFVRRILFLPSICDPMMERVRELVCTVGHNLDDPHVACLALLLAHMVVTPEGENPNTENSKFVTSIFQTLHLNINNTAWMGYAANLCSKFVLAMPIVANYVLVPDSQDDSLDKEKNDEADDLYEYGLMPMIVIKLLLWLKSRYSYGRQVISICSSHSTLHHHNPTFIDFSNTSTLLNSISLPMSRLLEHKLDKFSIDEFLNTEIRISACGDFLDTSWKSEYIKTVVRENYIDSSSLQSILEAFIRVLLGTKKEDNVCGCGKTGACNGRQSILSAYGYFVESGNGIEWSLSFLENELAKAVKTQSIDEISSSLSIGLLSLSNIHPSAFSNIPSTKNLLYILSSYLKFLIPFQNSSLTHSVYHSSSLLFVLLARIFGLLSSTHKQATLIKDLILRPPFGFFFALNLPLYKMTTTLCNSDAQTVSMLYADLDVIHSFAALLKQGQSPNISVSLQAISTLPAISSHVIFHSTFTLCDPLLSFSNQDTSHMKNKVKKIESFVNSICGTLQNKHTTLESISSDKSFEFLAHFVDILIFFLSSSSNFNLRQIQNLTISPNAPTKRESVDEFVEGLLIALISRLPLLLSVFSHPPKLSFLAPARSFLFPTFSLPSSFSKYPFILFLIFTSLPSTTLGKMEGEFWKEIVLESYETCKKEPHEAFLTGTFRDNIDRWMKEWLERYEVEETTAARFLPSFDVISPSISHLLRKSSGGTKSLQKCDSFLLDE